VQFTVRLNPYPPFAGRGKAPIGCSRHSQSLFIEPSNQLRSKGFCFTGSEIREPYVQERLERQGLMVGFQDQEPFAMEEQSCLSPENAVLDLLYRPVGSSNSLLDDLQTTLDPIPHRFQISRGNAVQVQMVRYLIKLPACAVTFVPAVSLANWKRTVPEGVAPAMTKPQIVQGQLCVVFGKPPTATSREALMFPRDIRIVVAVCAWSIFATPSVIPVAQAKPALGFTVAVAVLSNNCPSNS
jgi:hypothetical protein